jgi:hypothetical protein
MEVKMAVLDNTRHKIFTDGHKTCFKALILVIAFLCSAIASRGEEARPPGSSQPPDTTQYRRPAIPMDRAVARQIRPTVRGRLHAPSPNLLPNPTLLKLVDVNASAPGSDFVSRKEPSIAVDPENPNVIVVHGGFQDWASDMDPGPHCDSLFVSINGGTNWNRVQTINPPTNISITTGPNDTTLAYGANHLLTGSFLTRVTPRAGNDIFTGNTAAPSKIASFQWNTIEGGVVEAARVGPTGNNCSGTSVDRFRSAQPTDHINTHGTDQPWVAIHNYIPDPVVTEARSSINAPFPIPMQNDVYVAYSDFSRPDVPVRVAVSVGANPPNFTIDQQVGTRGSGSVNPGHRLAVAPQTIDNNGDLVGRGFVYSLHQRCADCSANPPKFDIVLNRTTDHGATWSLNGNPEGIVVAQASSQQPTPKFGTVNALFGGLDQVAVDPSNGLVYVVYGVFDETVQGNRIAMRRLIYEKCNEFSACDVLVPGPEIFVDDGQSPAALPAVAIAANGTVGVLYTTFGGMIGGLPVFVTHLAIADGRHGSSTFNIQSLMAFLSPDNDHHSDPNQRVLGDFQQMVAVGNRFYGVFPGNGAALGRSMVSIDPIVFIADVSNATPIPKARNTSRIHKQLR